VRVRAAAHVFVADVESPVLSPDDRHHLERVLRLRAGDSLTVADGAGHWRRCRFGATVEPIGDVTVEPAPSPPITVGFALTKGERPEWTVQKLTELGVDHIVPFVADRSVVRWEAEKITRNVERLRRVAREAAMQSRRAFLPVVDELTDFAGVAARRGATLAVPGGAPPDLARPVLLVGPEGGWSDDELARAPATTALGPTVLRAETAAVAGAALLTGLRTGLVHSSRSTGTRQQGSDLH
jgi:16S rRNA (uracil1498-N3)-methyltransferase